MTGVRDALTTLHEVWTRHIVETEAPGAFLDELVSDAPRLATPTSRLRREHSEILATIAKNVAVGTPAYQMIEAWLSRRPGPEEFEAWADYTRALVAKLSPKDREWVRSTSVGSAEATAKASGGLLGIALKKSRAESEVLKKVHAAFSA